VRAQKEFQDWALHVQAVDNSAEVHAPLPAPQDIPPCPSGLLEKNILPQDLKSLYESAGAEAAASLAALEQLTGCADLASPVRDPRSAFPLHGGEVEGIKRLQLYLYGESRTAQGGAGQRQNTGASIDTEAESRAATESGSTSSKSMQGERGNSSIESTASDARASTSAPIHSFKDTRMLAGGVDNSAKLSAYLAAGCLSPRMVYAEIQRARQLHGTDTGHSWLIMHLIIRCEPDASLFPLLIFHLGEIDIGGEWRSQL